MKFRSGFVSNSSSSSFIVIFKAGKACPTCGLSPSTFLDHLPEEKYYSEDTYIKGRSAAAVEEYFSDDFCCHDDDEIKEMKAIFEKLYIAEENGYTVYHLNISYNDNHLLKMIESDPNIEVLWSIN